MNSSFEKYIKAAMDSHKYDVVCEMANVIYPEKNKINIMQYPGNDVRVYKNREDEVQVLCPRDISYVQESNLTKAISTGTIFEDADEVDKYAGFIVKTKMPIDAMTNKGLENPYKMQEIAGATMGVMGEDGDVEISDVDVQNGRNVIDDLLDKDSKEFKDVKNVVDDYLDNDDHEYGYDRDFTYDIQQLRDEIQQFKDSDISPEDSITDMDWDDNWGSATSIMGDHTDAEDEKDDNDDDHDIEVSDDDDDEDDADITEESATYRLRDPFFTESYNNTLIDYKITEESGAGCMSCNPSGGGNVNKTINEETEPVVPGDSNTVPKPVMSSGSDIQESDSPVETPSVPPPPTNTTAGEPAGDKKMKPEDPDDLNSSPVTSNNHAPVMTAVKMESFHQEFSLKRPKHLKAIDVRSIVAYVTVEMNAIKDSNDQAMLAGYVCSKLELIDFYITVLDTHDDRYVVPHSRQYLADGQRQLSDLLTKILKIRPIDKSERIWKAIVS